MSGQRLSDKKQMNKAGATTHFCYSNWRMFLFFGGIFFKMFIAAVAHSKLLLFNRSSHFLCIAFVVFVHNHSVCCTRSIQSVFFRSNIDFSGQNSKNKWTNRSFFLTFVWWKHPEKVMKTNIFLGFLEVHCRMVFNVVFWHQLLLQNFVWHF